MGLVWKRIEDSHHLYDDLRFLRSFTLLVLWTCPSEGPKYFRKTEPSEANETHGIGFFFFFLRRQCHMAITIERYYRYRSCCTIRLSDNNILLLGLDWSRDKIWVTPSVLFCLFIIFLFCVCLLCVFFMISTTFYYRIN